MKRRIFITGDVHGDITGRFGYKHFKEGRTLSERDLVIVLGDFGLIWYNNKNSEEKYLIKFLEEKPWTTLFLDGNHENHDRLNKLPRVYYFNGIAGKVSNKIYHLRRGQIYKFNKSTFAVFGGAKSTDRNIRTLGKTYWEEEVPSEYEKTFFTKNLKRRDNKVDYILSHTMPNQALVEYFTRYKREDYGIDPTTYYLADLYSRVAFRRWFCGHFHINDMFLKGSLMCLYENIIELGEG